MLIEIKSYLTGNVLFYGDYKTIKSAVEAAVKDKIDLSWADLSMADLSRANLSGADLSRANLSGADLDDKFSFISISPIGSERGCLWVMRNDAGVLIYNRGCFSGTKDEFIRAVQEKHAGTEF